MKTNCLWQTGTSYTTCADCNIAFQQLLCCCNRVWAQAKHGMFRQTYCHCLCLQPAKTGWDRTFLFLLLLLNVRASVLSEHILCTFCMFVVTPLLYKHNITVGIYICIMALKRINMNELILKIKISLLDIIVFKLIKQ